MKKSILAIAISLLAFTSCIPEDERNCGTVIYKSKAFTERGDAIYSITIKAGIRAGQSYNVNKSTYEAREIGEKHYCHQDNLIPDRK